MAISRARPPVLRPAAVFAAALAALVTAALVGVDGLFTLRPAAAATRTERPDERDYYLSSNVAGQVDHHVLFFGLDDEATAHLRAADVLFVGNSRLMFALRPSVMRPYFARAALSYYVLGFGFAEADRFPLAIIRRFDLRPKLVVVNTDGFFGGGLSAWAEVVNRDTTFASRKLVWETNTAHRARTILEVVAPHWASLLGRPGLPAIRTFDTYRSRLDGTWQVVPWPPDGRPFNPRPPDGPRPARGELAAARAFFDDLTGRGARIVLTRVPTPKLNLGGSPAAFAELLGVPLIVAEAPALTTFDDSHLGEASAHDWSRAFAAALTPYLPAPAPARR